LDIGRETVVVRHLHPFLLSDSETNQQFFLFSYFIKTFKNNGVFLSNKQLLTIQRRSQQNSSSLVLLIQNIRQPVEKELIV
jgi:hypothetical protein